MVDIEDKERHDGRRVLRCRRCHHVFVSRPGFWFLGTPRIRCPRCQQTFPEIIKRDGVKIFRLKDAKRIAEEERQHGT